MKNSKHLRILPLAFVCRIATKISWIKTIWKLKNFPQENRLFIFQIIVYLYFMLGPWTKEEDELVVELVKKYGPKRWTLIAKHLKGRIGKQCRERWHNHLNPEIKKTAWTEEEDRVIYNAHKQWGN